MSERLEGEYLFEVVDGVFAADLTEEGRSLLKQRVDEHVGNIVAIRAVPLDNAEEPFTVFRPHEARRSL